MSFEYYVSILGSDQKQLKGETTKEGHKDDMPCIAFQMGSLVQVDTETGAPKGHRMHDPIVITKEAGAASPQILQAHWNNEILEKVVINIVGRSKDGKKEITKEKITLSHAVISSVKRYSLNSAKDKSASDVDHVEEIGFRFRKIEIENPEAGTHTVDDADQPNRK